MMSSVACPAMACRHQELHHGTGAMATGPDGRRGQAPKAWSSQKNLAEFGGESLF